MSAERRLRLKWVGCWRVEAPACRAGTRGRQRRRARRAARRRARRARGAGWRAAWPSRTAPSAAPTPSCLTRPSRGPPPRASAARLHAHATQRARALIYEYSIMRLLNSSILVQYCSIFARVARPNS